ncbi:MAG: 3'-5' exonuclease [Patescibacteria group bacterium]
MKGKYLILDLETSGLSPYQGHGLLQCAALALDESLDIVGQYNEFIKPPLTTIFDPIADRIHKIPREKTAEGLTYEEFSEHFVSWVKDIFGNVKPVMIGQFFVFDYNFLAYVIDSTLGNSPLLKDPEKEQFGLFNGVLSRDFIDTKAFVNIINTKCDLEGSDRYFPITSLSKEGGLKDKLGLNSQEYISHDALDDCKATRDVLIKLFEVIIIKK